MKAILGDYVAACGGDLPCGVLLQRMTHLMMNARLIKDDHLWYVASRVELMQATGLTEHKYKIARTKLTDMGFIEMTVAPSMKDAASLRTTAFRVREEAQVALASSLKNHQTGPVTVLQTGTVTHHQTKKESCYESGYGACYSGEASSTGKVTSTQIEKAFREEKTKLQPGYFHVAWNRRLQSTAKNFVKAVGAEQAEAVARVCFGEWSAFVEFAKKSTTMSISAEANIHALLTHAGAAVNFSLDRTAKGVNVNSMLKLSDL